MSEEEREDPQADDVDVDALQARLGRVREEVATRIVGQQEVVERLIVCVLADGNALLESNPGLGKTTMVRTVADVTDLEFSRIQNTPDLMPSDITGTEIIRESGGNREFVFERGPVFANVVLADEINRATPKTQAALLEAMQEKQVTAAGETHDLPRPFFLLATQNPIEQEGSLHPEESLYMDGRLWTAEEAVEYAKAEGELAHDGERTRVYDVGATTQTLRPDGTLAEAECMVYETDYDGAVYTVETKTGRTIRVSDNHPFLVNRGGAMTWVQARDLTEDDHLVTPRRVNLPSDPHVSHDEAMDRLEADPDFKVVRADRVRALKRKLHRGDELDADELDDLRLAGGLSKKELAARVDASYDQVLNFISGTENGIRDQLREAIHDLDIEVGDYVESYKTHRIDDELTEADAGFFVGFVLAEGRVTDTAISVSQKNLPELLDRWIEIAERVGLDIATRTDPTGKEARISSKPFVAYLDERFHLRSPEKLLAAPEPFREELLETLLLTESHYDAELRRITFSQKDRTVTNLVAHLLIGFGIVPWLYEQPEKYVLKIQGEDVARYLDHFEWRGREPEVGTFDSAHRTTPLPRDTVAKLVRDLGMKYDRPLAIREWYNSYRSLQSSRDRMATPYFRSFLDDVDRTVEHRRWVDIEAAAEDDLGIAAKYGGLAMTDIVDNTTLSKHRVWRSYCSGESPDEAIDYAVDEFNYRIGEAEALSNYLHGLVDGDVFYDPVTSIEAEPYSGPVIGLSVPEHHNYVAGLGGCGISHNTYPLPEAQTDRFLLKILLDYPTEDEERSIVDLYTEGRPVPPVEKVLTRAEIQQAQSLVREVPIAEDVRDRVIRLVRSTREAEAVEYGASPRASMGLVLTAKARAFLRGRNHVSWEDVESMAPPVLRHRILLDFRAEREGLTTDDVVADLLDEA